MLVSGLLQLKLYQHQNSLYLDRMLKFSIFTAESYINPKSN
jgi:hypothetical protein